jgi:hypothetical protein
MTYIFRHYITFYKSFSCFVEHYFQKKNWLYPMAIC